LNADQKNIDFLSWPHQNCSGLRISYLFILFVLSSLLLSACKKSSDVVADGWLQKRKYRKGFHLDLAKHKR